MSMKFALHKNILKNCEVNLFIANQNINIQVIGLGHCHCQNHHLLKI